MKFNLLISLFSIMLLVATGSASAMSNSASGSKNETIAFNLFKKDTKTKHETKHDGVKTSHGNKHHKKQVKHPKHTSIILCLQNLELTLDNILINLD